MVEGAPAGKGYDGGFGVGLMAKDLRLALQTARQSGARTVLGERVEEVYATVARDGRYGRKDFSVVYEWLRGGGGER